jgi:hypothetical protein
METPKPKSLGELWGKLKREKYCTVEEAAELIAQKVHPDHGYDWMDEVRSECKQEYLVYLKGLVLSGRIALINPHTSNKFDYTILTDTRFPSDGLIERTNLYACLMQKHQDKGFFPKPISRAPAPIIPITLTGIRSAPPPVSVYKFDKPNWEHWMRPGTIVRLWEGICLVVDIEPPRPFGKEVWSLIELRRLNLPEKFQMAWETLNRDEAFSRAEEVGTAGRMLHTTNLDRFAYWASYKGFDLPPQMLELAKRSGMAVEEDAKAKARGDGKKTPEESGSVEKLTRIKPQGGDSLTPMIWEICYQLHDNRQEITPRPVMAELKRRASSQAHPLVGCVAGGVAYEYEKGDERELNAEQLRGRIREWKRINAVD